MYFGVQNHRNASVVNGNTSGSSVRFVRYMRPLSIIMYGLDADSLSSHHSSLTRPSE